MNVFLTGATGFVGSHLVKGLLAAGHSVRALVRSLDKARTRAPGIEYTPGDILEAASLREVMPGCDAVIHLVGTITEAKGATFERVHHEGTRKVVAAAQASRIRRFVHMSALGTRPNAVAAYHKTKWKGEEAVRTGGIPWVILRPSLIYGPGIYGPGIYGPGIYGPGDGFTTHMLQLMRKVPLRPIVGSGQYPVQPIYIEDVVDCFVQSLSGDAALGREVALGGPRAMPIEEMLDALADAASIRKRKIHLPFWLMYANAAFLEAFLPFPPVTRNQLTMMREGSTCDTAPMLTTFRMKHWTLEEGLKQMRFEP